MAAYALRRLLAAIPVLLFVSFVTFGLVRLAPGDPVLIVLGGKRISPELLVTLREKFGLDGDPISQYVAWIGRVLTGDLGQSYKLKQEVADLIGGRLRSPSSWSSSRWGSRSSSRSRSASGRRAGGTPQRSEEHTSELQSH